MKEQAKRKKDTREEDVDRSEWAFQSKYGHSSWRWAFQSKWGHSSQRFGNSVEDWAFQSKYGHSSPRFGIPVEKWVFQSKYGHSSWRMGIPVKVWAFQLKFGHSSQSMGIPVNQIWYSNQSSRMSIRVGHRHYRRSLDIPVGIVSIPAKVWTFQYNQLGIPIKVQEWGIQSRTIRHSQSKQWTFQSESEYGHSSQTNGHLQS